MAINTKISWTDHSINFWTGCKKVADGCKFCYMYRDKERHGKDATVVMKVSQSTINSHLKAAKAGDKIFTCSWSDFFIEEADQWRDWAWDIIRSRPDLNWQILTKRPERIKQCLPADWGEGWANVWLGTSVSSQKDVQNIVELLKVPAKIRWISAEPLLGELDITNKGLNDAYNFPTATDSKGRSIEWADVGDSFIGLSWCVVGGESGNDEGKWLYRPCELEWIDRIVQDCRRAGVPVWVKQLGTHLSKKLGLTRHAADINEFPEYLQFQEFPKNIITAESVA